MIKKYFAMTIIAASVSLAACSDDDDNSGSNGGTTQPDVATPGVGGTAFDTVVNSDDHTILEAAIIAAGLDATLDNPATDFTIFAPNDAAFAVVTVGDPAAPVTAETVGQVDGLARILSYHVVEGSEGSEALIARLNDGDDTTNALPTILVDAAGTDQEITQTVTITGEGANGVSVGGVEVIAVDQTILGADEVAETPAIGTVHVLGGLLTVPDAPVIPDPNEGNGGNGGANANLPAAVQDGGANSIVGAAMASTFSGQFTGSDVASPGAATESDQWTFFVPTDEAVAGVDAATLNGVLAGHIITNVNPLVDGTDALMADNSSQAVTSDGTTITIGGLEATLLGETPQGGVIYSIPGILTATTP